MGKILASVLFVFFVSSQALAAEYLTVSAHVGEIGSYDPDLPYFQTSVVDFHDEGLGHIGVSFSKNEHVDIVSISEIVGLLKEGGAQYWYTFTGRVGVTDETFTTYSQNFDIEGVLFSSSNSYVLSDGITSPPHVFIASVYSEPISFDEEFEFWDDGTTFDYSFRGTFEKSVPEPGSLVLLFVGATSCLVCRR